MGGLVVVSLAAAFTALNLGGQAALWENAHWTLATGVMTLLGWLGWRSARGPTRRIRGLLTLGLLSYTIGQLLWDYQWALGLTAFPALSDVFYLGLAPCFTLALILAVHSRLSRLEVLATYLDNTTIFIALTTAILAWYGPRVAAPDSLTTTVLIAYPVVFLANAGAGLSAALATRARPAITGPYLLLVGLAASGMCWVVWNSMALEGVIPPGTLVGYGFSYAHILIGLGVAVWDDTPSDDRRFERWAGLLLRVSPLVAIPMAVSAMVWGRAQVTAFGEWIVAGASVVIALAVIRQSVLLWERDDLLRRKQAALQLAERELAERQRVEEALREAEVKYRVLVENMPAIVYLIQTDLSALSGYRSVYVSPQLETILGYKPEDFIADPNLWLAILHPEDREQAHAADLRHFETGEALLQEYRLIARDGRVVWFRDTATRIQDEAGGKTLSQGVLLDITEHKRAEAALRESQERLQLFFNQSLDGFFFSMLDEPKAWNDSIDKDSVVGYVLTQQRITEVNEAMAKQYGATRENLLGRTASDFFAHDLAQARRFRRQLFDAGRLHLDTEERTDNGLPIWIEGDYVCIYDERGRIAGMFGIQRDVTERKQAEAILQESQKRLQAFFNQSLDGFFFMMLESPRVWDDTVDKETVLDDILAHARYTDVNQAMLEQYGLTREKFLSRTSSDFFAHDPPQGRRLRRKLFDHGHLHLETYERKDDGTPVWFEGAYVCFYDEHKRITGFFGIQRDITDRKQAEAALREAEAKYRQLVERLPVVVYTSELSVNGAWPYVSPQIEDLLGFTPEEWMTDSGRWYRQVHSEDRDRQQALEEQAYARGEPLDSEYRMFTRTGHEIWVRDTAQFLPPKDGGPPIVQGVMLDITARKQAEEKLERQNQRLKALREIDTAILAADSVENIVGAALSHIRALIACRRASVALIDWPTNTAQIFDVRMLGETSIPKGTQVPVSLFQAMLQTLTENQAVLINDLAAMPNPPPLFQTGIKEGLRALCVLPLFSQSGLIGAFSMSSEIPGFFDEEKINLGHEVANQVAIAITQNRLVEALKHLNADLEQRVVELQQAESEIRAQGRYLTLLNDITRAAIDTPDFQSMLQTLANRMNELLGADGCYLTLWDEAQQRTIPAAAHGALSETYATLAPKPEEATMTASVMRAGHALVAEDVFNTPYLSPRIAAQFPTRSMLGLPLIANSEKLGAVLIAFNQPHHFTPDEIARGEQAAAQIALAVAKARLLEQVQRHAAELEQRVAERTAQLEAANKELEAFSYSVSHDLRAPLRAIESFSRLMQEQAAQLDADGQHYLRRVREATQRMGQLIEDLLRLSRITRAEVRRGPVSLSRLARIVAAELQHLHPERAVTCMITEDINAEGDEQLLRIVLENLLGNAWKFTVHQPQARIEFGRAEHERRPVYFVRDNGAGFDMVYSHRLFGAFQRLHSETEFPGSGVGLATVQRIIHRHGGRIWAEGAVNQGATFYFTL